MLHRTAKLTPFGRRLLVDRVLIEGWSAVSAAEMLGVSQNRRPFEDSRPEQHIARIT